MNDAGANSISGVNIGGVAGDLYGSVITGRDFVLQFVHQTGNQIPQIRNLSVQLLALQQTLSHFTHPNEKAAIQVAIEKLEQVITELPIHEQRYRDHIKARYAEDVAYYIPLAGESTEITPIQIEAKSPRSARRRQLRAEYCEWLSEEQEIQRVRLNTLRDSVDKYPCVILLGDPGSGKTTGLENLAYQFATESDKLPLPLHLSEFRPGMSVEEFIIQGWGGSLEAGHWGASELAANMDEYLETGRLFCLFDALNEMPKEGYNERILALRHFIDKWTGKGNRFLVTCRVLDYGEELSGLQRVEVLPLDDDQIKAFLQNELPQDWQALWHALIGTRDEKRRLLEMARNPYMLTMMIDIFAEDEQLGQNRAELMTRFTQILMKWAKTKCSPDEWLETDIQREALAKLAFETQFRSGFGTMIKTEQAITVMSQQVKPYLNWPLLPSPPEKILNLAARANIIEMPMNRSSLRFYHQLLQEYFAAHEMLKRNPANLADLWRWPWLEREMPLWVRSEGNHDPLPPPSPTGWEETTILAASLAVENDDQLMRVLLQVNPVLAGRCIYEGRARVAKAIRQAVIDELLVTITRPEVAIRVRIAAGEVLGCLGDPRLGEMITIPEGKFLMGEGKEQHELFMPTFQIGKYPVTNVEFGRFIEARGYKNECWWTVAGLKWKSSRREPNYWRDEHFNKPNQPIVGVSWYEGVAYCRWLSVETGQLYRLPTEAEWEKAARGVDGRLYPWGDKFDSNRLNARKGKQQVRNTTPVGIYPTGISPFGVLDCAGNVREWCATKWRKPYPYNVAENEWMVDYLEGEELRVVRGGSWNNNQTNVRCTHRVFLKPDNKSSRRGCRVVLSV